MLMICGRVSRVSKMSGQWETGEDGERALRRWKAFRYDRKAEAVCFIMPPCPDRSAYRHLECKMANEQTENPRTAPMGKGQHQQNSIR